MFKDYPLIKESNKTVTLFYPYIPKNYLSALKKVFTTRWVGQGPLVDKLEKKNVIHKNKAARLKSKLMKKKSS